MTNGTGIEFFDHPSFTDQEYLKRKESIINKARQYKLSDPEIPRIEYTRVEK